MRLSAGMSSLLRAAAEVLLSTAVRCLLAQLVSAEPAVYLYSIALLPPPTQLCVFVKVEVGQEEK